MLWDNMTPERIAPGSPELEGTWGWGGWGWTSSVNTTANTTATSTAEEEVVSSTAELVNNSNDEGGESGIKNSNNDNTKTTQHDKDDEGEVASSTKTKRPKSSISFKGKLYVHNHPRNSDYILCTCKEDNCRGSFKLYRWLFNIKHPNPDSLVVKRAHTCMNTEGVLSMMPTIQTVIDKFINILKGTDNVGIRRSPKDDNYKEMLKVYFNITDDNIKSRSISLETCTQNELGPANNRHSNSDDDSDDYRGLTIHSPPHDVRTDFLANIKVLLPITNEETEIWTILVGCKDDRWHAPVLQTSRFEELRKLIMKTSKWYEKTIRRHYPKLNIIHLNALQSAPGAEEQNCLHLDYNILTQEKEVSSQPISAIIAIEQFRLDIVTDSSNKKLKTITVEPGDMIVFPNKCIHRGGPNKTNKNQRRIWDIMCNISSCNHRAWQFEVSQQTLPLRMDHTHKR